jgi:hypothetical protein
MSEENINTETVTFDDAQAARVSEIVRERLTRQNSVHAAELAAARATQTPAGLGANAEAVISDLTKQSTSDSTTEALTKLFRGTDARRINELALKDPQTYKNLRKEAVARGIIKG